MIESINVHPQYIRIKPEDKRLVPVLIELFNGHLVHEDIHCNSKSSVYVKADYFNVGKEV